jgi:predicted Zn finger-like uncharacterized protein
MIIICINCNKKFNIDSNLIPDNGRLLECSSCNHQWYFKKEEATFKDSTILPNQNIENSEEILIPSREKISNPSVKDNFNEIKQEKISDNKLLSNDKNTNVAELIEDNEKTVVVNKKPKILSLMIVFIISFIALIILVDTFKSPISKIIPNIEIILYNLYESIKDIKLFLNDLI